MMRILKTINGMMTIKELLLMTTQPQSYQGVIILTLLTAQYIG